MRGAALPGSGGSAGAAAGWRFKAAPQSWGELGGSHVLFWGGRDSCLGPLVISLWPLVISLDSRDHRIHQPAEDAARFHAELQQQPAGFHPGMDQIPEEGPQGKNLGLGRVRGWNGAGSGPGAHPVSPRTPCFAQIITDVIGNPEEERRAEFYQQPWAQEAVGRHIFAKVGSGPCRWGAAAGLGWQRGGVSLGQPLSPRQPLSLPDWPSSPPGPAASAGTGTSARDPPHLRGQRGLGSSFSSPCCLSLTVLLTGIKYSTCTNPTCLEGFGATRAPGLPSAGKL